ncbi:L-serine ammonia-lyase, iron-sulfur-dependent, subunit alpha [Limosilactobacillus fermentum]|uniref:L-serine ammonia-lyase, iron-sulfur-dependent, subunit alpha n=1 Tax=Limosilactobacillus fermentum TaxID=1613 RepID=UPI0021A7108E|nr:L-serine ammonia-lyase, iron-sulfur-dependent, subunit alpha [Limosilactobacillus fermentum]MCT3457382.1 L-serine ammonia-lyase, iron-sulfur-dependent, subunit alpha [Limosilactobacillus fermentum]
MLKSIDELVTTATNQGLPLSEVIINQEILTSGKSREQIFQRMRNNLATMKAAVERGTSGQGVHSATGLTGGQAVKVKEYRQTHRTLSGAAVEGAIATNEVNAAMGVICATPTAGSSGTLPGILFALNDRLKLTEDQMLHFLFTAGGMGMIIANKASIAGASGGCQAEVGSASAMGAAAAVEIAGGTPVQSANALAIAMSNLLGLVCDPLAGLVEVPCVNRNATGAGNALIAADLALAGCTSLVPADEVIAAMDKIGRQMPVELRETGLGGLAGTPTGQQIKLRIFGKDLES